MATRVKARLNMIQRGILVGSAILILGTRFCFAAGGADVAGAVMNGNRAVLRTLLQQKADVNAAQEDGATALHWA